VLYLVLGLVLAAFGLLITALTTANTLFAWLSVAVSVLAAGLLVFDWLIGRRRAREAEEEAADDHSAHVERPFADESRPLTETARGGPAREEPAAREPERSRTGRAGRERVEPAHAEPAGALLAEEPAEQTEHVAPVEQTAAAEPVHADEPWLDEPAHEPELSEPEEPADVRYARLAGRQPREEPVEEGEPGEEQTDASDLLAVAGLGYEVRVVDEHPRYHLDTCRYLADKPTLPLPVSEARQLGFTPCVRCGPDGVLAARHRATR
jgi:hypothetical protein